MRYPDLRRQDVGGVNDAVHVARVAVGLGDPVLAVALEEAGAIVPAAAGERVAAGATLQTVVARPGGNRIATLRRIRNDVHAARIGDEVVSRCADENVR